ncbi:MAG: hypothetical protein K8S55_04730 [Phycisphaerae bacterium]|nr:hypothetical protein [Phycisphaerae bacterium]
MQHMMTLSDQEIEVLDGLLHAEVSDARIELRRTSNYKFRAVVQHRIDMEERILDKIEHLTTAHV